MTDARKAMADKAVSALKDGVRSIKDLEVELTRKGVLTMEARSALNSAAAELGVYVLSAEGPAGLMWVLNIGTEYEKKVLDAQAEAIGNLTAEEADLYNAFVAQKKLEGDKF